MVGFNWGRGGTLRAHISKRGKCRSFFNIKAKQPRSAGTTPRSIRSGQVRSESALSPEDAGHQLHVSSRGAAERAAQRGGKDRATAVKFQAARCDITIRSVQKWMREFKAGLITSTLRKPTAGRPSKCTVEEQTRPAGIEALLEKSHHKLTYSALAKLPRVPATTLKRWAPCKCQWGWQQKRS